MSQLNLDDDLIQEYVVECQEHLANIEADLMEIEQAGDAADDQLINRVFRAAHSIKGGAGFFDLVKIRDLAHKTENVLDMVRSHQLTPTPELVSILLIAFDKLRELIQDYRESNNAEITDFVEALSALATNGMSADQKREQNSVVSIAAPSRMPMIEVSAFDLTQARRGGRTVYLIWFDLIHDIQRQGLRPYDVIKRLMQSGTVLDTVFDIDSAGTLDDEPSNQLRLEVLYATALEPDMIELLVSVPRERLGVVQQDGSVLMFEDHISRAGAIVSPIRPLETSSVQNLAAAVEEKIFVPEPAPSPEEPNPVVKLKKQPTQAQAEKPNEPASVRLAVTLLDTLMTLAGELVLSRNQLNEALSRTDDRAIRSAAQRLSAVTTEMQEAVTLTRMQPVGSLFGRFPRLVRDLGKDLGKNVVLEIEGGEVEIDKTILEGLADPLTHMVRNSVDHGIELEKDRIAKGKPARGTVMLRAAHQAGQVVIEVNDDGKGLDPEKIASAAVRKEAISREQLATLTDREKLALIFLPGVSTSEKVSDLSGRGVGMDVVKTNLDKLGGKVEIQSVVGQGTSFRIKLPLTLAIIPSLLVSDGGERFAIPQVNVSELIRIPEDQIKDKIARAGSKELLMMRNRLIPILDLTAALGNTTDGSLRVGADRAINVALVDTGTFQYGLVVDELHDTAEIVVKPLGQHLKTLSEYAGATILGDGRLAVILDVAGIAARGGITSASAEMAARASEQRLDSENAGESVSLMMFDNAPGEKCAVPTQLISRLERVEPHQISYLGGRRTMIYRDALLPIVQLEDCARVGSIDSSQPWVVIVIEWMGQSFGLLASEPLDLIETVLTVDRSTLHQPGLIGSFIHNGTTVLMVEVGDLALSAGLTPPAPAEDLSSYDSTADLDGNVNSPSNQPTVVVAEDSDFFRGQIRRLVEATGCTVLEAEDGQAAWELLESIDCSKVDLVAVATDVEMPRLDGLSLAKKIKSDDRFKAITVIALSSLAGEEDIARGLASGVDEYQVKLNSEELVSSIQRAMSARRR